MRHSEATKVNTAYATSGDGLEWQWHGTVLEGRPGQWDARGARLTCVLPDGRAAYDGNCAGCHVADLGGRNEAPQLAGADFMNSWRTRTTKDLFEFIRNSGAYRKVQTHKIDFLNFKEVDVSRTRVVDADLGYEWDRSITYVKAQDFFVVVDGIRIRTPGYYTFANLWHTRKIIEQGKQFFSTVIDAIGN